MLKHTLHGLTVLVCIPAFAADVVETSYPLAGRYRPGKYMPVRVRTSVAGQFTLAARGGLQIEGKFDGRSVDAVVPLLAVQSLISDATWRLGDSPAVRLRGALLPLQEDDRLVGFTAPTSQDASTLFPDKNVVPVRLDSLDPLPEPLAAWEALDAVVLEGRAVEWLTERRLVRLLAAGTTVAVRTADRPTGAWPWKRRGAYWIVTPSLVGPTSAIAPAAYAPTTGWRPGRSARFRRQLTLGLVAFSIALSATALWRSRWAAAVGVVVALSAAGVIVVWASSITPIAVAGGAVIVDGEVRQIDRWIDYKTIAPARLSVPWSPVATLHPIFASARHLSTLEARLQIDADAKPIAIGAKLDPDTALATLSRQVHATDPPLATDSSITSPLREVARDLYLPGGGGEIIDQSSTIEVDDRLEPENHWPAVVIRRP